jgi:dTMP kinase
MGSGRFIVLEGIDGAGTTTQTALLVDWMNARAWPAVATREPSGGAVGKLLRVLLAESDAKMDGAAMALLFAADRMDHLAREITPALARGVHVVSDRYYHSSLAYQAEETDRDFVAAVNARARRPDLTVILSVPADEAAARRERARRQTERYDALLLQERIAKNYEALAARLGGHEPIVVVPGTLPVAEVHASIRREVERICG